jgi:transposase
MEWAESPNRSVAYTEHVPLMGLRDEGGPNVRYIGVDLHKRNFVVCFLGEDDTIKLQTYPLTDTGLSTFCRGLRPDDQMAVETAQNAYYFYDRVHPAVNKVVLVDPYRFAVIAKSKKKTDRHDAVTLARFLKLGWLPTVPIPTEKIRHLRQLCQARENLVQMATQLKNMGHAALARNGIALNHAALNGLGSRRRLAHLAGLAPLDQQILGVALRQLDALDREIDVLETEILRVGKDLPGLPRLLQIRGLSALTAIVLLAEIGDIAWFENSKQLAAYAGLATSVRQSGATDRHGKITKQGRKRLRTIAIRTVLAMVNGKRTPLMQFYARKKQEKGAGKALCATARKLLTIIFVMLKRDLDYWYLEDRLYQRKLQMLRTSA